MNHIKNDELDSLIRNSLEFMDGDGLVITDYELLEDHILQLVENIISMQE